MILTISDKVKGEGNTQSTRDRKAARDEPKVQIIYTLRNSSIEITAATEAKADGEQDMINTVSKRVNEGDQRVIEIGPSAKIKQLRQAIRDDLGIKEKISLKLYVPVSADQQKAKVASAEDQEEVKEGDNPPMSLDYLMEDGDAVLIDDKLAIKETPLIENKDKLQVEVVIKVSIDVQGKGKDYSASIDVSPDAAILSTLQSRLSFFKTFFYQRRMQLYIVSKDQSVAPVLIDDLNKTFKEWNLKEDGCMLQLREPGKSKNAY